MTELYVRRSRLGTALIVRAIPTAIAALIITFSSDHSPALGITVFFAFCFALAPVLLLTTVWVPLEGISRILFGINTGATLISGVIAVASIGSDRQTLILIVSIWAAITGISELYAGYRYSDRVIAREWIASGAFTALLALVLAVIPVNDVYAVGLIGAYGAILAVFLIIAGLSIQADAKNDLSSSTETEVSS